jgi:ribosomal protein S18 acetylase RimI-like enzyme
MVPAAGLTGRPDGAALAGRPARDEDLPAIVRLHRAAMPYSLNSRLGPEHLRRIYQVACRHPESLVACVSAGGEVAGVVSATLDPAALAARARAGLSLTGWIWLLASLALRPGLWPLVWENIQLTPPVRWRGEDVNACLTAIAVAPKQRRTGLGRILVEAVDDFMRAHGQAAYRLDTLVVNAGARQFYERLGFEAADRRGSSVIFVKAL